MSSSLKPLLVLFALSALLVSAPTEARDLRADGPRGTRERVALTLVRLLPVQPKPARRFAPVPAVQEPAIAAVWLDRELVWMGPADEFQGAIERFPFDRLQPDPGTPPRAPELRDGREICVGMAIRPDSGSHLEEDLFEIDCDFVPAR